MSVYRKFDRNDILSTTVHTAPRVTLASGSNGWRGNTGVSSSLSLYEGVRGRTVPGLVVNPLDPIDTHSIDKVVFVSGSYPSTGSVQFVKVRNSPVVGPSNLKLNHDNWYEEHFRPIEGLYNYYSQFNSNYFTGSYDYYSLFFNQNTDGNASAVEFSGSLLSSLSGAITAEAWIKPISFSGSYSGSVGFMIQSQRGRFRFYLNSLGKLVFDDRRGTILSSSVSVVTGSWSHVYFSGDGASGSFRINNVEVGTGVLTSSIFSSESGSLVVGAEQVDSFYNSGFKGYIFESRIWKKSLSESERSGSWNRTLIQSGSSDLLHYARFNDGPLSTAHGFAAGSGTLEYGRAGVHGRLRNFSVDLPRSPIWQPNDNTGFYTTKVATTNPIQMMKVLHVPSMFYGRQIATGSVRLTCNAYSGKGISRVLVDDGRGSLYVSGSMVRSISGEDVGGVKWNKVGNVFYTEGLIAITDPSLLDFGETELDWDDSSDHLAVKFDGVNRIPSKVFVCRLGTTDANGSNNPTYSSIDSTDGEPHLNGEATTWITAIGIYNEERKLVAIAKLASPIRKREKDKLAIRLRMDF